jgi:hypothetical protein
MLHSSWLTGRKSQPVPNPPHAVSLNRNVLITVALTASLLAAFNMFLLLPHQGTRVTTTGATIRIERPSGKVFQLDFLFRLEVRQQRFNLSEFFSAGYQVSLVGRELELKVFLTANLATACHRAEEVAAECGPTVSDQL